MNADCNVQLFINEYKKQFQTLSALVTAIEQLESTIQNKVSFFNENSLPYSSTSANNNVLSAAIGLNVPPFGKADMTSTGVILYANNNNYYTTSIKPQNESSKSYYYSIATGQVSTATPNNT